MAAMPKRHRSPAPDAARPPKRQDSAHDVLAAEEFAMPTRDPALEPAHDVLAAEEFAVPTADPELEPAHDVLAADEFAMPTADPALHHGPVVLPDDPSGIEGPHDVLAAEEFAMPATRLTTGDQARRPSRSVSRAATLVTFAAVLIRLLRGRG
jgi:hypothetical protein